LADGVDPNTRLEFMRGDVVCLRGTVRAFASRRLQEDDRVGPVHVRWRDTLTAFKSTRGDLT
jgi:hypothetical protein